MAALLGVEGSVAETALSFSASLVGVSGIMLGLVSRCGEEGGAETSLVTSPAKIKNYLHFLIIQLPLKEVSS
jgi:hypothetical protein